MSVAEGQGGGRCAAFWLAADPSSLENVRSVNNDGGNRGTSAKRND